MTRKIKGMTRKNAQKNKNTQNDSILTIFVFKYFLAKSLILIEK